MSHCSTHSVPRWKALQDTHWLGPGPQQPPTHSGWQTCPSSSENTCRARENKAWCTLCFLLTSPHTVQRTHYHCVTTVLLSAFWELKLPSLNLFQWEMFEKITKEAQRKTVKGLCRQAPPVSSTANIYHATSMNVFCHRAVFCSWVSRTINRMNSYQNHNMCNFLNHKGCNFLTKVESVTT